MTINRTMLFTYTLAHFFVDFACAFLMYRLIFGTQSWVLALLLYNFCAFAMQMPTGLIADYVNRNAVFAAIGCVLVAIAFLFGELGLLAAVIAGIGNGMFHIGGGIDVLNSSREKPTLLGIFVAPGAFGIYYGAVFGKQESFPLWLVVLIILFTAFAILMACYTYKKSFNSDNESVSFETIKVSGILLAIICLLFVVVLRSYLGMIMNFPWKSEGNWATVLLFAVVLGKAAGGLLASKAGFMRASVLSLVLCAVLFVLADYPIAGVSAVFFFNMTMPITLWAVARLLKGSKGFSFGLLTFGLFLGFVPVYLEISPLVTTYAGFSLAAVLSLVLLWVGLKKAVV